MELRKLKIKICGMRDERNIIEVATLHPEYMGFIFYPRSPRYVGLDFWIPDALPPSIARVGVFVDAHIKEVVRTAEKHRLNVIQLHGIESPTYCSALRAEGLQVMKVVSIESGADLVRIATYAGSVDFFLFDTRTAAFGGSGVAFDWNLLDTYTMNVPFFLSGGISEHNILNVPRRKEVYAIDLNSGVETSPGLKDLEKLHRVLSLVDRKEAIEP